VATLSSADAKQAGIEVATVSEQDVDDTLLTSGRIAFNELKVGHVYSPVTGQVQRITAVLGQRVSKGQSLAVIQSPDVGVASSDLGKAKADLEAAQRDFERVQVLVKQSAATPRDVEQSEDNYRKAKAEMERAQQKAYLLRSGGGVTQGYAVFAPIEGYVLARNIAPGIEVQGQYSGAATAVELFTVGEIDQVWVLADIYESDLARGHTDQKVVVTVVAYPDKAFEGQIDWVSWFLDPATRTEKMRCTLDNKGERLKPEMYATVSIAVEAKRALAVPRDAVIQTADQTLVYVQSGPDSQGKLQFERLPVTVDLDGMRDWVPVTHGLDSGQKVVVKGRQKLPGLGGG